MRQKETATQNWKNRMAIAKKELKGIGQQRVVEFVIKADPTIDTLANVTRWRNAWTMNVADPQFTELVEQAVDHFGDSGK